MPSQGILESMKRLPGRFIVFEGLDGAGTTTQQQRLLALLANHGVAVHGTAEPSQQDTGKLIRRVLRGEADSVSAETMALLFAADRRVHLQTEILPQLAKGTHVICDRYLLSSLAYQQAAGVDRDFIAMANRDIYLPDLTILLTVPVQIAAQRRMQRQQPRDLYETDLFQKQVADLYEKEVMQALDPQAYQVLDGAGPVEHVERLVHRALDSLLGIKIAH